MQDGEDGQQAVGGGGGVVGRHLPHYFLSVFICPAAPQLLWHEAVLGPAINGEGIHIKER